ncbi:oxidoreductase [Fusarium tjaetaba]|uniref:Oxidoreductase n=1 Tax=Fusarium tjaetaba TaxID=1567544 RepID=A0A8H5RBK7_9HYPO|nr:oxidoreductase [Fusarium tjaetaba]KAF5630237.1 oxidoreductase [Fusarium tjaetaba]
MLEAYVTLISMAAMKALPEKNVKTYLPDALHFQRAIQNARQACWDAIVLTYKNSEECPIRMPLEMRIMGGSGVIMAPQRGNALGTCRESLKTHPHWAKEWHGYTVDGKPWIGRLEAVDYKGERQQFLQTLADIGKKAGWPLQDLQERFSNDLFDVLFFDKKPQKN